MGRVERDLERAIQKAMRDMEPVEQTDKPKRGRRPYKDRSKLRNRVTMTMLPEVKIMATRLGDGNMSRGIEAAVKRCFAQSVKEGEI